MNLDRSTIELIMTSILFLGGAIYVVAQAYNGRGQKKLDDVTEASRTIELIKQRADALEVRVEELEKQGLEDQKKIAALTAEKGYIEDLNKKYLEILQNRNPELEIYMKSSTKALETIMGAVQQLLQKPATPSVNIHNESPK